MNMARRRPVAGTKPCLKTSESRPWFAEREELTPHVERIFVEESRKHNAPSKDACRTVASALMVVRARVTAVRQDTLTPSIKRAHKSAMALHGHLQPLRQRLAGRFYELEEMGLDAEPHNAELTLLDAAVETVEELFPALDRLAPWPDRDPSLFIAEKVREAWEEANNGRSPKSKDAGGPLVNVVTRLLALVLYEQKQKPKSETVSARLKLRRNSKLGQIQRAKNVPRPD